MTCACSALAADQIFSIANVLAWARHVLWGVNGGRSSRSPQTHCVPRARAAGRASAGEIAWARNPASALAAGQRGRSIPVVPRSCTRRVQRCTRIARTEGPKVGQGAGCGSSRRRWEGGGKEPTRTCQGAPQHQQVTRLAVPIALQRKNVRQRNSAARNAVHKKLAAAARPQPTTHDMGPGSEAWQPERAAAIRVCKSS